MMMPLAEYAIAVCLRLRGLCGGRCDGTPSPTAKSVFRRALSLPVVGRLGISTLERDNGAHIARHLREGLPVKKESGVMKSSDKSWVLAAMMLVALGGCICTSCPPLRVTAPSKGKSWMSPASLGWIWGVQGGQRPGSQDGNQDG